VNKLSAKLRLCLINPPVLAVFEPWYDSPDFGRTALAYLAGYLRQFPEYEIIIIDAKFEKLDFEQTRQRVVYFKPDIIGLTAFTNEIKPAAYLTALIKTSIPGVLSIIGGVHITAIPVETLLEFPYFDIGVVGEGEQTLYEVCKARLAGTTLENINGLVLRKNGEVFLTTPRERILDQDSIPFPAWDMLPKAQTYYVQSVRGCPYNCLFCMNPNGKVARKRSVYNVIRELNWIISDFKPQRISFGDELFSIDIQRTHELLDAIINERIGYKVSWDVQTHVNYVDEELFRKFKIANVDRVELGIETGDENLLKKMGKGTNMQSIKEACNAGRKEGVKIGTFLLFGQPNETKESIHKTINIAVEINPSIPMFGLMTPYPGTEVARMAACGEGGYKLLTMDWDQYNKQIGGALAFANLTRRQIEWYQIKAYLMVYIRNYRFSDLIKFLWEYRTGAWIVLKKVLFKKDLTNMVTLPEYYEEITGKGITPDKEIFSSSRISWQQTQNRELNRLKLKRSKEFNSFISPSDEKN